MTVLIIGGGDLDTAFLKERLAFHRGAVIIAADRGLAALNAVGVRPDYLLGDYDSAPPEAVEAYRQSLAEGKCEGGDEGLCENDNGSALNRQLSCEGRLYQDNGRSFQILPAVKDYTDTEAAIRKAMALGCDSLVLLGMTGGRLDHFLGVVHNLMIPYRAGIPAVIEDTGNRIRLTGGRTEVYRGSEEDARFGRYPVWGRYLSLIPLTTPVRGVSLTGLAYTLEEKDPEPGSSLCLSNEMVSDEAVITIREGLMVMVMSEDRSRDGERR